MASTPPLPPPPPPPQQPPEPTRSMPSATSTAGAASALLRTGEPRLEGPEPPPPVPESQLLRIFTEFDIDQSGVITRHDVQLALRKAGLAVTDKQADAMLLSASNKPSLGHDDFVVLVEQLVGVTNIAELDMPTVARLWVQHSHTKRRTLGENRTATSALRSLVGGGIAGALGKSVIAPLDRTKILFQVSDKPFSLRAAFSEVRRILMEEGPRALWKGNSATVARVFPYAGVQFMSFEQYKWLFLSPSKQRLKPWERLVVGGLAGATSVVFTYPLDLMRARMAVQVSQRHYRNLLHAFRRLSQEEGARSAFRGLSPTLLGVLPYAGLSFMTFGTLKQMATDMSGGNVHPLVTLACGATAGLIAQSATYPLDLVRRRMQTHGFLHRVHTSTKAVPLYGGIYSTLVGIYRHESPRALFKGLSMNWIKGPIAVGVSFTTYDFMKRWLDIEPSRY